MNDKGLRVLSRLGVMVPLTPWPVIIWISSQEDYPWGKHSASALFAVSSESLVICAVFSLIGIGLVLAGSQTLGSLDAAEVKGLAIAFLLLNWWIMHQWILAASCVQV